MYNNAESGHPWGTPRIRINVPDFNFTLDIVVSSLNHVNEIVPVIQFTKGRENEIPIRLDKNP